MRRPHAHLVAAVLLVAACSRAGRADGELEGPERIEARMLETQAARNDAPPSTAVSPDQVDGSQPPEAVQQATTPAERAVPDRNFPDSVAGIAFGMSGSEVVEVCAKAGAAVAVLCESGGKVEALLSAEAGAPQLGDSIACLDRVPVDPFKTSNPAQAAYAKLCEEPGGGIRVCEIQLALTDHRVEAASLLRQRFEDRYGTPDEWKPEHPCQSPLHQRDTYSVSWLWTVELDGKPFPEGHLLLNFMCTPLVDPPELFLTYRDALGTIVHFRQRARETDEY